MSRFIQVSGACALALLGAPPVSAASDAELAEIQAQIQQLKQSYEARIEALDRRLQEAEARSAKAPAPAASPAAATVAAAPAATPAAVSASNSAFNPAIYAVLQGAYINQSKDPDKYAIAGFVPSGDIGPGKRGFSIAESELGFSANVDHKFFGNLILALTPDNNVEVEEAYGVFTALPGGVTPKFGRFLSSVGYLNDQHQHAWDFYDAPLVYQAFFGGQFRNDGLQVKWLAPTDTYLQFGAEVGDGSSFPGSERSNGRNGIGGGALHAHVGGDIDVSNSWRAGLSWLTLRPNERTHTEIDRNGNPAKLEFSGRSQVAIADFVWKYAPNGNAKETHFKLQGEYFWRKERGNLRYDSDGALGLTNTARNTSRQNGFYVQGVYQFMPEWRVGARYDHLDPGRVDYGGNAAYLCASSFNPKRYSLMFDYTPSEFSRFRIQYQQSKLQPDFTDNILFVQYILTLGAHGAHSY
ncbi:hypothetical protein [Accumulibacter sp.]|uniref:hypothetical protein n=1 Tax=Accumulibacter sp. TaxID=2053492 RepID=UPI001A4CEA46|nr:hypothetical protein [Accumulibacter sp.]MBL8401921.1 carbohydrate porin [Accumulibacter sp.]